MERERRHNQLPLTAIHIDLVEMAIEFEDQYGTVGRLALADGVVIYEGAPLLLEPAAEPHDEPAMSAVPPPDRVPDYRGPSQH